VRKRTKNNTPPVEEIEGEKKRQFHNLSVLMVQ